MVIDHQWLIIDDQWSSMIIHDQWSSMINHWWSMIINDSSLMINGHECWHLSKFGRFFVDLLLTWGHYWIIVGYIGSRFGNICCRFVQLFENWQKVRWKYFEKWDRLVSSIEKHVGDMFGFGKMKLYRFV